jgi:predicted HicB family RNase H-like nuclease
MSTRLSWVYVHPIGAAMINGKHKFPATTIRIDPRLKAAAAAKADSQGKTLTDVIRESLEHYIAQGTDSPTK